MYVNVYIFVSQVCYMVIVSHYQKVVHTYDPCTNHSISIDLIKSLLSFTWNPFWGLLGEPNAID